MARRHADVLGAPRHAVAQIRRAVDVATDPRQIEDRRLGRPAPPRCCFSQASICGRRCARSLIRVWMPVMAVCASRREVAAMCCSAKAAILSAISGLDELAPSIG